MASIQPFDRHRRELLPNPPWHLDGGRNIAEPANSNSPLIGSRPVIAVPGEGADLAAIDDDQGAIAVVFDLVNPAIPGRRLPDRERNFRLNPAKRRGEPNISAQCRGAAQPCSRLCSRCFRHQFRRWRYLLPYSGHIAGARAGASVVRSVAKRNDWLVGTPVFVLTVIIGVPADFLGRARGLFPYCEGSACLINIGRSPLSALCNLTRIGLA